LIEHNKNIMIRTLRPEHLRTLCQQIGHHGAIAGNRVTFGAESIDDRLEGGLAQRALHEVFAASVEDASAAAAFALLISLRARSINRPFIWVRENRCCRRTGNVHAAGLVELGIDPDDLILVDVPDALAVLRAGADIVKCDQVGAVIIEPWGKAPLLDLTASRRLAMAASASGVMTLILRVDAKPVPSAAQTRWQIAAAPSAALAANAPGHPAFDIALLRHRGGIAGFETRLEWNRDTRSFAQLSGGVSSVFAVGADQARQAA
jgi:protein ImuA